jgi:8-hydroxy-5-deazaflavin:NADPH oxidoreductase
MAHQTIAVFGGTGKQGGGIAQRLAKAGRRVTIASRDPAAAAATVARWPFPAGSFAIAGYRDAAASHDVIVLAIPFDAADAAIDDCGAELRPGAIVIDVTVPVTFEFGAPSMLHVEEGSAAEHIKARLGDRAAVAATFKTVPASLLNDLDQPMDCDELICADSAEARDEAVALIAAVDGLRPIDVGPLSRARSIEHLTLLAIHINRRRKIHDARYRVVGV